MRWSPDQTGLVERPDVTRLNPQPKSQSYICFLSFVISFSLCPVISSHSPLDTCFSWKKPQKKPQRGRYAAPQYGWILLKTQDPNKNFYKELPYKMPQSKPKVAQIIEIQQEHPEKKKKKTQLNITHVSENSPQYLCNPPQNKITPERP